MLQRPSKIAKRIVYTPREDRVSADQPKPFLGMNARERMRRGQPAGGTLYGSPVWEMAKRVREQRLRRIGKEEATDGQA